MFITTKTGKPAWLIEHDTSVLYALSDPAAGHTAHHSVSSYDFFAGHREATAAEISEFGTPRRKAKAVAKSKPAAVKKKPAAKKPKALPRPSQAGVGARKAGPAATTPPGADKPPGGSPTPPGGESGKT